MIRVLAVAVLAFAPMAAAQEMATRLAGQVLANPVIEDYRVEIEP